MQFTDQGVLNVTLEDISGLYAYRDRDGVVFEDGFAFELKLQRIELTPGSVRGVELQFSAAELVYPEDYAELKERCILWSGRQTLNSTGKSHLFQKVSSLFITSHPVLG